MKFYVYITTNPNKTSRYIGFTNNLEQRIIEHYLNRGKQETYAGKYFCYLLVFYEEYKYVNDAIAREKEIKKWRREKKLQLINDFNSDWKALNDELFVINGRRLKMNFTTGKIYNLKHRFLPSVEMTKGETLFISTFLLAGISNQ